MCCILKMLIQYKCIFRKLFLTFQDTAEEEIEAEMGVVRLVSYETNAVFTVKNNIAEKFHLQTSCPQVEFTAVNVEAQMSL